MTTSQTITLPLVVAIIAAAIGSSFQFGLALGSLNTPETVSECFTARELHAKYDEILFVSVYAAYKRLD